MERCKCISGSSIISVLFAGTHSTCAAKYRTARSPSLIWFELYWISESSRVKKAKNLASSTCSFLCGKMTFHIWVNLSIEVNGGSGLSSRVGAALHSFTNFSLSLFFRAISAASTLSKSSTSLVVYFPHSQRYPFPRLPDFSSVP